MYKVANKKADNFVNTASDILVHTPTAVSRIFRQTALVHTINSSHYII